MQHLVFYRINPGYVGNVNCTFVHNPPTLEDIRNLEKDISEKFGEGAPAVVTGWEKLADSDDIKNSKFERYLNITIKKRTLAPNDIIEITDNYGSCVYVIHFGLYQYNETMHIGWYMTLDAVSENYPEENQVLLRPLYDLMSDSIKNFKIVGEAE